MASVQQIKRRIRSVKSTKQITKAMELVAASKMRRAQEATLRSRIYANTANEILTRLSELIDVKGHPLFAQRAVKSKLFIVIASDRGLAGAYNSNILKTLANTLKTEIDAGVSVKVVTIGRQASRFVARLEDVEHIGAYDDFADNPTEKDVKPIVETVFSRFEGLKEDEVVVLYTDFKSSIVQEVTAKKLLPAAFVETENSLEVDRDMFEPSPKRVLETITPRLIEVQLFQAILESQASEQSMRMMAMKSATDNAGDIIDDLTLVYNSARQASITQELAEITAGAEAIA
jgi:F-type H+-transporting ATPase subunit gamma